MSFTPYDWEDEERRDSKRFADPSVYDEGPDPSEYEDRVDPEFLDDVADDEPEYTYSQQAAMREGYSPDDDIWMLRGCLGILVAILLSFMVVILGGGIWWAF